MLSACPILYKNWKTQLITQFPIKIKFTILTLTIFFYLGTLTFVHLTYLSPFLSYHPWKIVINKHNSLI
jgi:hypothetical protein